MTCTPRKHRIVAEVDKKAADKGKYLRPELFGLSSEYKIGVPSLRKSDKPISPSAYGQVKNYQSNMVKKATARKK